jgi:hypothetical protein
MERPSLSNVLLIIPDCKLQVTGDDTLLLVIAGGITRKLENFRSQVFKDRSEIYCEKESDGKYGTERGARD